MSYDFRVVEIDDEEPASCACGRRRERVYIDLGDPTYNIGGILRRATGVVFAQSKRMPLTDALAMWEGACRTMEAAESNEDELAQYRALEPGNGWGDFESAVRVAHRTRIALAEIVDAGGVRVPEWEALRSEEYDSDEERDAKPMRFVRADRLVFVA